MIDLIAMTQTSSTMLNGIDKHNFLASLAKRIAFHLLFFEYDVVCECATHGFY